MEDEPATFAPNLQLPGLAPAGELLSCGDKKVTKETLPAASACGFPRDRPPAPPAPKIA